MVQMTHDRVVNAFKVWNPKRKWHTLHKNKKLFNKCIAKTFLKWWRRHASLPQLRQSIFHNNKHTAYFTEWRLVVCHLRPIWHCETFFVFAIFFPPKDSALITAAAGCRQTAGCCMQLKTTVATTTTYKTCNALPGSATRYSLLPWRQETVT